MITAKTDWPVLVFSQWTEELRLPGVKKLSGEDDLYRVRVGDYRVVYQIRDNELIVLIVRVAHCREVYR
jgi:mRNA interferase RelE/StbE